ncbi:proto-oncogene tyrosine-protein kinase receptor Ret-like, partial [Hemiscyllium ocellatum]|uniref:proto-oncogene tyrosine-protein kinase receptor Ret-like n=1 Tax=Hemiscyllium ocellatum TaxID=170820 RepID=UPI0029673AEB
MIPLVGVSDTLKKWHNLIDSIRDSAEGKPEWSLSYITTTGCFSFVLLSLMYYVIDVRVWGSGEPFIFPVVLGLYFPRKTYQTTVYIGQPADTPLLQVYALPEEGNRTAYFGFCNNLLNGFRHQWFRIDERSGVFYLNKTLEENDLQLLGNMGGPELYKITLHIFAAPEPRREKE